MNVKGTPQPTGRRAESLFVNPFEWVLGPGKIFDATINEEEKDVSVSRLYLSTVFLG